MPAPWDTTTRTDTTMTFATDDEGNAEATFYLACRDDRGALSDTLVQFMPLRNFPPAVNFQSDFDPLGNMQREFIMRRRRRRSTPCTGTGAPRISASSPSISTATRPWTISTATPWPTTEPAETYDLDDPQADPLTSWVRVPFDGAGEVREFEIFVVGAAGRAGGP